MHPNDIIKCLPSYLVNSESYYVIVVNWEGDFLCTNKYFQHSFPDWVGKAYQDFVQQEDVAQYRKLLHLFEIGIGIPMHFKVRKTTHTTRYSRWISWELSVLKDTTGTPIGVLQIGHEITEIGSLYNNIKDFRKKVKTVLENMTDGFYMLNTSWEFVGINLKAQELLGKSDKELINKIIWDVFPETKDSELMYAFQTALVTEKSQILELYHPHLKQWYELIAYPSKEGIAVFFKDITERHWIEEQLRYSESKLRAILDSTSDANILISPQYKILTVNKKAEENTLQLMGKTIREGDNMWDYVIPSTKEDFRNNFEKCLKGEVIKLEKEIPYPQNYKIWFRFVYYPVYDRKGELLGVSFNATNIDKEKRDEQNLLFSENKLQAMYDSYADSHILLDTNMCILSFNKIAEEWANELFGKKMEEGMSFIHFVTNAAQNDFIESFKRVLQGEKTEFQRKRFFQHLQRNIWFLIRYAPIYDKSQNIIGVSLNSIDISKIKEAEERIAQQNEVLRLIAWKQSHQVRRPVANILGLIQLIKDDFEKESSFLQDYLNYLEQSTEDLDEIIKEIVRLSNDITELGEAENEA
jgi:PAS domain S-box-containing protein